MLARVFQQHGLLCATHPWEVIVFFITVAFSLNTLSGVLFYNERSRTEVVRTKGFDIFLSFLTLIAASGYLFHQFKQFYRQRSNALLAISAVYTAFSSALFAGSVLAVLRGDFGELKEALPVFVLLTDLSRASLLVQFALTSSSLAEVPQNIGRGMSTVGPSVALDSIVKLLLLGIGTMSGMKHIERLCRYACLATIVNFGLFIAFLPAFLSLIVELSGGCSLDTNGDTSSPRRETSTPTFREVRSRSVQSNLGRIRLCEQQEKQKPNPVLQRVKVIMSGGLVLVHMHSRWPLNDRPGDASDGNGTQSTIDALLTAAVSSTTSPTDRTGGGILTAWLATTPEQLLILVLACALAVKYIFFENGEELLRLHFANVLGASSRSFVNNTAREPSPQIQPQAMNVIERNNVSKMMERHDGPDVIVSHRRSSDSLNNAMERVSFILGDDEDSDSVHKQVQTDPLIVYNGNHLKQSLPRRQSSDTPPRSIAECVSLLATEGGPQQLTDAEVLNLVAAKQVPAYNLESVLDDPERGVAIRRMMVAKDAKCGDALERLPYRFYDYSMVMGACCENVIGYMPVPVGVAGPLLLDDRRFFVPMATTEGCLIASTNRGCRAIAFGGGARSSIVHDGMTRGPVVKFPTAKEAATVMVWLQKDENFRVIKEAFDGTSRFARLQKAHCRIAAKYLFIRFVSISGDAMGMNMLSKGTEIALLKLQELFPTMEVISVSGNYCTDKKAAAVNWIEGRGKSVVCEAIVPGKVIRDVLKTTSPALVEVNLSKNLIGSAVAGSLGGYNAQAANIVTAIYIATGQDPAQNVVSSNCLTILELCGEDDLYISCTMPSIELGTIGGGTVLPPQGAMLDLLGVKGPCLENPGENAATLASVVCATVLAGELSLLSALAAGHLVKSHMRHNRSSIHMNVAAQAAKNAQSSTGSLLSPKKNNSLYCMTNGS